jgi:hypothetical protein
LRKGGEEHVKLNYGCLRDANGLALNDQYAPEMLNLSNEVLRKPGVHLHTTLIISAAFVGSGRVAQICPSSPRS